MSFLNPIQRDTRRRDIAATEGQTVFNGDFPLYDGADIGVYFQTPPGTVLAKQPASTYDVAPVAPFAHFIVTFHAAPWPIDGLPVIVRLQGERTQERLTDVTRGGTFNSALLEAELDRMSIILQELRRDQDDLLSQFAALLVPLQMQASGPLMPVTAPTMYQFREALNALNQEFAFEQSLPGSSTDPLRRQWSGQFVHVGSGLWNAATAFTGFTDASLLAIATSFPE